MIFNTKFFGEVELDEKYIINFEDGIPGFNEYKNYALIDVEDKKFKCLQSIDNVNLCLILISPFDYFNDYEINLSSDDLNKLEIKTQDEVLVFNIVTVRESNITTNLVAPIIINILNKKGCQIVLSDNKYSIREKIECLF